LLDARARERGSKQSKQSETISEAPGTPIQEKRERDGSPAKEKLSLPSEEERELVNKNVKMAAAHVIDGLAGRLENGLANALKADAFTRACFLLQTNNLFLNVRLHTRTIIAHTARLLFYAY
jgi:hypothetical protein